MKYSIIIFIIFILFLNTYSQNCNTSSCSNCSILTSTQTCQLLCQQQCLVCNPASNSYKSIWENYNDTLDKPISAVALVIVIFIMIFYFFLLSSGLGITRQCFQNLQLIGLITWSCGFQKQLLILRITNFCQIKSSFFQSFGIQFISILIVLLIFFLLVVSIQNTQSDPYSNLVKLFKRKKCIFPFRIYTNFFNILIFCIFTQFSKNDQSQQAVLSLIFCTIAVIYLAVGYLTLLILVNYMNVKSQDIRYYALYQLQVGSSKNMMLKNQIIISLLTRFLIIISFIFSYQNPLVVQCLISMFQAIYTTYFTVFVRYTKKRYIIVNFLSNLLTFVILFLTSGATKYLQTDVSTANRYQVVTNIFIFVYICSFLAFLCLQLCANFLKIKRQLRSVYYRFILCQVNEDGILLNKYDEDEHKEKVREFNQNPLHNRKIKDIELDYGL